MGEGQRHPDLVLRVEKGSVAGLSQHHRGQRAPGHNALACLQTSWWPRSFSLLPPFRAPGLSDGQRPEVLRSLPTQVFHFPLLLSSPPPPFFSSCLLVSFPSHGLPPLLFHLGLVQEAGQPLTLASNVPGLPFFILVLPTWTTRKFSLRSDLHLPALWKIKPCSE